MVFPEEIGFRTPHNAKYPYGPLVTDGFKFAVIPRNIPQNCSKTNIISFSKKTKKSPSPIQSDSKIENLLKTQITSCKNSASDVNTSRGRSPKNSTRFETWFQCLKAFKCNKSLTTHTKKKQKSTESALNCEYVPRSCEPEDIVHPQSSKSTLPQIQPSRPSNENTVKSVCPQTEIPETPKECTGSNKCTDPQILCTETFKTQKEDLSAKTCNVSCERLKKENAPEDGKKSITRLTGTAELQTSEFEKLSCQCMKQLTGKCECLLNIYEACRAKFKSTTEPQTSFPKMESSPNAQNSTDIYESLQRYDQFVQIKEKVPTVEIRHQPVFELPKDGNKSIVHLGSTTEMQTLFLGNIIYYESQQRSDPVVQNTENAQTVENKHQEILELPKDAKESIPRFKGTTELQTPFLDKVSDPCENLQKPEQVDQNKEQTSLVKKRSSPNVKRKNGKCEGKQETAVTVECECQAKLELPNICKECRSLLKDNKWKIKCECQQTLTTPESCPEFGENAPTVKLQKKVKTQCLETQPNRKLDKNIITCECSQTPDLQIMCPKCGKAINFLMLIDR